MTEQIASIQGCLTLTQEEMTQVIAALRERRRQTARAIDFLRDQLRYTLVGSHARKGTVVALERLGHDLDTTNRITGQAEDLLKFITSMEGETSE